MGEDVSEDLLAGEATPLSAPSVDEVSSPDEQSERSEKAVVEVFDLQESSGDDISPDMESQALFVKLKEVRGFTFNLYRGASCLVLVCHLWGGGGV